jgi:hypothetical protein
MSKVSVGALTRGATVPVTVTMSNLGVAPTYDGWYVQFRLNDASGKRVWTKNLWIDLKTHLPATTKSYATRLVVPTTLPRGTYTASVGVKDKLSYTPDMYLSNYTRRADGGYTLGSVVVG